TTLGFGGLVFTTGLRDTAAAVAVAATVVVWTFGEMIAMPAMSAFIVDVAPATRRGLYMGTLTLAFGAGLTIGPKFGTTLLNAQGATALWLAVGAIGAASTLL